MITHKSAMYAVQIDVDYLGLRAADVVVDVLPLAFGYGFHQLLKTFLVGGTLVLERSFAYPAETLTRIAAERVTGFPGIPTTFAFLLQQDLRSYDLSSVRYLTSMGAPLSPSLIRQIRSAFPSAQLYSMYSLTEACNALGLDPAELETHPTSVGKPLGDTEAWLVGDDGARVGAGEIGELVVSGDHVRSGYWNDPALSRWRFRPGRRDGERLCYTGDLFRTDAEGHFYFLGRNDEIIKSGGRKIAPRHIEDVLYMLPGVIEAAVVGVPDETWGHSIYAFVVLDERLHPRPTEADLVRACSERLERFMVPRRVAIRSDLPKTASGKIKKSELALEVRW
jgi:acyl-coenzyme A synthetase/AMP-(fatty) acid ligase